MITIWDKPHAYYPQNVTHFGDVNKREICACGKERGDAIHGVVKDVDHPAHYGGDTTYEAIKVIEAWSLGFCLGNVVKYIRRAGHKGSYLKDLKKARWYLDRAIAQEEKE